MANLRYREEVGTPASPPSQAIMAGGARLVSLENDSDLSDWINGGSRLVLVSFFLRLSFLLGVRYAKSLASSCC